MTKKEMIKTINAANKRMQRMRKKGYTKGDEYRKAQAAISRTENDNPFIKDRTTLKASSKMTSAELKKRYRTAKQIVKKKELTIAYVKKEISEKKMKTFETEKGIVIKNKRKFFDLLNSDSFKRLSSASGWGSDQVLRSVREQINKGQNIDTLQKKLDDYMKSSQKDGYYLDSFEAAIQ